MIELVPKVRNKSIRRLSERESSSESRLKIVFSERRRKVASLENNVPF